jgi:hypothetical protein
MIGESYEERKKRYKFEKKRRDKRDLTARLRRSYGLPLARYKQMFKEQNLRCAICKRNGQKLNVDHDHVTGKVRGLLCLRCNTLILPTVEHHFGLIAVASAYLSRFFDS